MKRVLWTNGNTKYVNIINTTKQSLKNLKSQLTQEGRGGERKSVRKGGPLRHQLPQLPALSCWRSGVPIFAMYDAHFFFAQIFEGKIRILIIYG